MLQQITEEFDKKYEKPGILKLLLIKKISHFKHPAPLPSTNSKTNKERVTEFFYQAVDLPTSD